MPYNLVHEVAEIRATPTTVEILHKGVRVASHVRSRNQGKTMRGFAIRSRLRGYYMHVTTGGDRASPKWKLFWFPLVSGSRI